MKKIITASLLAACLACAGYSQTVTNAPAPITGGLEQVASWFTAVPTNLVIGPYASASLVKDPGYKLANWTVGLAGAWNISKNVGVGGAVDYDPTGSSFTLITASVTLRQAITPFSNYPNFVITPYAMAGAGTPISGASAGNGCLETVAGGGVAASLFDVAGWRVGVSGAYVNWSGQCLASGNRVYFAVGATKGVGGPAKSKVASISTWPRG